MCAHIRNWSTSCLYVCFHGSPSWSSYASHLNLFLLSSTFVPWQAMKRLNDLFPFLKQSWSHKIWLPTCIIMQLHAASWGVCFDLRWSKWGKQPPCLPSFKNHWVSLHCCYFHLPQDQVTLIRAFTEGLGMCGLRERKESSLCRVNVYSCVWMHSIYNGENSNVSPKGHCILDASVYLI